MLHTARFIAFLMLVPGFVIGYMPYGILSNYHKPIGIDGWKYAGYIFLIAGSILFLCSITAFFLHGKGTPAIWLLKPLKSLVGDEPKELVDKGIYKFQEPNVPWSIGSTIGIGFIK